MSKITRRSYKRKKIIMGASLFGAIGLVSTGFAAWVLSAPTSTTVGPTNLNVGDVTDKNMEFKDVKTYKTGTDTEYDEYHFEPAADDKSGRVRLGGEQAESLKLDVKGQLLRVQNLGNIQGIISVENPTQKANFDLAIQRGYIVAPEAYKSSETALWTKGDPQPTLNANFTATIADDAVSGDKVMTFKYEVFFTWGSAFGGQNPSLYFDAEPQYSGIATGTPDDAYDAEHPENNTVGAILKNMHDLLDGVSLTLTLTANPD